MVRIEKYGPILDTAIEAAKEFTECRSADVAVPKYPKALGMAADLYSFLGRLNECIDFRFYEGTKHGRRFLGKSDAKGETKYRVDFIIENCGFFIPDESEFSSYADNTLIGLKNSNSRTNVSAGSSQISERFACRRNNFFSYIQEIKPDKPKPENKFSIVLTYHSTDYFINTFFQAFEPITEFRHKNAEPGYTYPISFEKTHILNFEAWKFFQNPAFWNSISAFHSMSINEMVGNDFDNKSKLYIDYLRHHEKSHDEVVRMFVAMKNGRDLSSVADELGCPPEYKGIFLSLPLRTMKYFCNPYSLLNEKKAEQLRRLSESLGERGLDMTPEELSMIFEKKDKQG